MHAAVSPDIRARERRWIVKLVVRASLFCAAFALAAEVLAQSSPSPAGWWVNLSLPSPAWTVFEDREHGSGSGSGMAGCISVSRLGGTGVLTVVAVHGAVSIGPAYPWPVEMHEYGDIGLLMGAASKSESFCASIAAGPAAVMTFALPFGPHELTVGVTLESQIFVILARWLGFGVVLSAAVTPDGVFGGHALCVQLGRLRP
jgi:hypothetical protein